MTDTPTAAADYIREYMTARVPDRAKAALVIVDMQYASGSRDGALGRRMLAERSNLTDYRFDRIERLVVPNILRLAPLFRVSWVNNSPPGAAPSGRGFSKLTAGSCHTSLMNPSLTSFLSGPALL